MSTLTIQPDNSSDIALLVDNDASFSSPTPISGTFSGGVLTLSNVNLSGGNVFFTVAFNIPTPAGIVANPSLWFKSDAGVEEATGDETENGDFVRFWLDQSGNNYNGEQNETGERPSYNATNTINFNPVLSFNGNTHLPIRDLSYNLTTNTLNEVTIYSIVKSNQSDEGIIVSYDRSSFFRFALNHNGTPNFGLSTAVDGASDEIDDTNASNTASNDFPHLIGADYTTSTDVKNLFFDGATSSTFSGAHGATGGILGESTEVPRFGYIGANSEADSFDSNNSATGINGDLAEIVYFEEILSTTDRARLESYLAIKYGITLSSDYVASDGTTAVWDNSANTGYNSDIFALGLDNTAGINQSQSRSEAPGSIVTASEASLANNEYVFFGSDEADLTITTSGTGSKTGRFNRVWKFQITGSTTNVDQLRFDLSDLIIRPNDAGNYSLLIDDANDFGSVIREVNATSFNDGILQFDNVDLTGGSFISVAVSPDLDNDGIADAVDLDDDNDGILDSNE
ncbi:MAG: hypothetical protein AAFY41_09950, partial [Bacteroidota bacterium]